MAIVPKVISRLGFRGYLNKTNAISPPRPFLDSPLKRGEGSKHKDVGKDEGSSRRIFTCVSY